jgi:hypothetical protein
MNLCGYCHLNLTLSNIGLTYGFNDFFSKMPVFSEFVGFKHLKRSMKEEGMRVVVSSLQYPEHTPY